MTSRWIIFINHNYEINRDGLDYLWFLIHGGGESCSSRYLFLNINLAYCLYDCVQLQMDSTCSRVMICFSGPAELFWDTYWVRLLRKKLKSQCDLSWLNIDVTSGTHSTSELYPASFPFRIKSGRMSVFHPYWSTSVQRHLLCLLSKDARFTKTFCQNATYMYHCHEAVGVSCLGTENTVFHYLTLRV